MFSSSCKYYDEDTKDWKTEGCEVYLILVLFYLHKYI